MRLTQSFSRRHKEYFAVGLRRVQLSRSGATLSAGRVAYFGVPTSGLNILNTRGPPLVISFHAAFCGREKKLFCCDRWQNSASLEIESSHMN